MTSPAPIRTHSLRLASARALAVALALGVVLTAAKPVLEPSGATWELPAVSFVSQGKAKKLGKTTTESLETATITLGEETGDGPTRGAFTLTLDGQDLGGTYSRKNRRAKTARLVFDVPSIMALAELQERALELSMFEDGHSVDLQLAVDQAKTKHRLTLETDAEAGTTTAKLRSQVRLIGTATDADDKVTTTRVKLTAKGDSLPVDSSAVVVTD